MGFAMFTVSQTIIPAKLGISPDTCVTAIAVGAGGGGGSGGSAKEYDDDDGTTTNAGGGGGGGAAGEVKIASFVFPDVNQSIQVTIGLPGAGGVYSKTDIAAGNGKKGGDTFVGSYIRAAGGGGGKRGGDANSALGAPGVGGDGETPGGSGFLTYGGAGAGGYQLGIFKNVGKAGCITWESGLNPYIISPAQGTGGGAGYNETLPGGPFGGGDGGKGGGGGGGFGGGGGGGIALDSPYGYANEKNNGASAGRGAAGGKDGYVYMGKPGGGLVLLFW